MPDAEHVLFSARSGDSTNIWRLTLSSKTWRVSGAPEQVTFGTGIEEKAAVVGNRMFFVSATGNVDLWSLPLDPRSGRVAGALERLTREPGRDDWPSVSADGKRLAFLSERAGVPAVRLQDAETRRELSVTLAPTRVAYPRISADGTKVVYLVPVAQRRGRGGDAFAGAAIEIPASRCPFFSREPSSWLRLVLRARWVCRARYARPAPARGTGPGTAAMSRTGGPTRSSCWMSRAVRGCGSPPARGGPPSTLAFLQTIRGSRSRLNFGSPRRQIVVAPFRGPTPIPESEWVTVIDGETLDRQAAWAADGNALYFPSQRDGFRCLWMQRLDPRRSGRSARRFRSSTSTGCSTR